MLTDLKLEDLIYQKVSLKIIMLSSTEKTSSIDSGTKR